MLSRFDAVLFLACFVSGALALENHSRIDIAAPDEGVAIASTCQPKARQAAMRLRSISLAPDVWVDPTNFAGACAAQ